MRNLCIIGGVVVMTINCSLAQPATNEISSATTNAATAIAEKSEAKSWSFSASANAYFVPDDQNYVQPTFTADYDWLHLEARYNYEALDTGSAWIGYNFSVGDKLTLEATPMVGGVFGDTTGVAPGYEFTLGYWKLELYSEGEYVFDTRDSSGSFFYTWTELTLAPTEWLQVGFVVQRTKAYQTDLDLQRGFLVGFSYKKVNVTTYVFNPDESNPTVVLGASVNF